MLENERIKISVIITAFNIEDYIGKCLESILNQTYRNLEIIIINDGSTDQTLSVIQECIKNDSRVIIINQVNQGVNESRKNGYLKSKGDYLLFVDGDDWLETDAVEKLVEVIQHQEVDIVLFDILKVTNDGSRPLILNYLNSTLERVDLLESLFLYEIYPSVWSKMIKKEFLMKLDTPFCPRLNYAEDLATCAKWFQNQPTYFYLNQYLYNYYQRENSITQNVDVKILDIDKALLWIKENLNNNQIFTKYKESFEYMVFCHLFESKVLKTPKEKNPFHKQIYDQWKAYKINSKDNKLIYNRITQAPFALRIRIKFYLISYNLGILFDWIRMVMLSTLKMEKKI
ncbi:Hyaluronan synthase [Turicibacter sanguinis]|nr:Hyaluronan synthase [Turicibacter sanguinis]